MVNPLYIPAATAIITSALDNLSSVQGDNKPEAERLARELRKRLENARHTAEDLEEAEGLAAFRAARAEYSTGKEREKWLEKARKAKAKAAGYRAGLDVIYEEMIRLAGADHLNQGGGNGQPGAAPGDQAS